MVLQAGHEPALVPQASLGPSSPPCLGIPLRTPSHPTPGSHPPGCGCVRPGFGSDAACRPPLGPGLPDADLCAGDPASERLVWPQCLWLGCLPKYLVQGAAQSPGFVAPVKLGRKSAEVHCLLPGQGGHPTSSEPPHPHFLHPLPHRPSLTVVLPTHHLPTPAKGSPRSRRR